MNLLKPVLIVLTLFSLTKLNAQINLDSLWSVWSDPSQVDTNRLKAMKSIAWDGYLYSKPDTAFYFAQMLYDSALKTDKKQFMAKALAIQVLSLKYRSKLDSAIDFGKRLLDLNTFLGDESKVANTYFQIGSIYSKKGEIIISNSYYENSLKVFRAIDDKTGIINSFNNLGNNHFSNANLSDALDCYLNSLSVSKELGDSNKIASCLFNVGRIYHANSDYDNAFNYYNESLVFFEKIENLKYFSAINSNIGVIYYEQGNYEKGLEYLTKSLKINEKIGNNNGIATDLMNIGNTYYFIGDLAKALLYYNKSLRIYKEIGNKLQIGKSYVNIGDVYLDQGDLKKALDYLTEAKKIFQEINVISELDNILKEISLVYKKLGKQKQALEMYELYMEIKDSISKMSAEEQLYKFEVEKQYALDKQADSIKYADEIILHQAEAKTEKQRRNGLLIISILVLVSLGLVFTQLKKVRKGKKLVESQKQIVEEKQKEITDSINYAKRLQQGILVPFDLVQSWLSESFILFKPKDLVSGDFYWTEKVGNKVYFAVADCTGHGIPGALVSIICSNALTKSLYEDFTYEPSRILDNTRSIVEERFERAKDEIKDGMDISLCCLNVEERSITWAGAMNPLWIVRKGADEIRVIKPDNQPVSKVENPKRYTQHEVKLAKGDSVYLFSDGYQDQFGGEKDKKYMKGRFKKFILSIQDQDMKTQLASFEKEFNTWKGDREQIDDVCVMGVRIT